jgi:hypothetical protein
MTASAGSINRPTAARKPSVRTRDTIAKPTSITTAIENRVEYVGGRLDVRLGVGEELSGRARAVEGERELEIAIDDPAAQRALHAKRRHPGEIASQDYARRPQADDADERGRAQPQRARRHAAPKARIDDVVGDAAEHDRARHGRRRVDRRAHDGESERQRMGGDVRGHDA